MSSATLTRKAAAAAAAAASASTNLVDTAAGSGGSQDAEHFEHARTTRKRTELCKETLWKQVMQAVTNTFPDERSGWRIPSTQEKFCVLCDEGGGLLLHCHQSRCDAVYHPWCLAKSVTQDSDIGIQLLQPENTDVRPLHVWCTRHLKQKQPKFCSCLKPFEQDGEPMVQCDSCQEWYHYACVGLEEDSQPEQYECPACEKGAPSAETIRKNKQKGAFSDELSDGSSFARAMIAIQLCCPMMDKLKNLQKTIRDRPTEDHIKHLKGKLEKLLTSDSDAENPSSSFSPQTIMKPYGIASLLLEWIQFVDDSRKRSLKWSENALELIQNSCNLITDTCKTSNIFVAATDSTDNNLQSVCERAQENCESFREDIHSLAVRPDYIDSFDLEVRGLFTLTSTTIKLRKLIGQIQTDTLTQDEKVIADLLEWCKHVEVQEDLISSRTSVVKLQSKLALANLRRNFEEHLVFIQNILQLASQLQVQPKTATFDEIQNALAQVSTVYQIFQFMESFKMLKSIIEQGEELKQRYDLCINSSTYDAFEQDMKVIATDVNHFPVILGVEEELANTIAAIDCSETIESLSKGKRAKQYEIEQLKSQLTDKIDNLNDVKASNYLALRTKLEAETRQLDNILAEASSFKEEAQACLSHPTSDSDFFQACLSRLEQCPVIWPTEFLIRRIVECQIASSRLQKLASENDTKPDLEEMKALQTRVTTLLGDQLWQLYPQTVFVRDDLLASFSKVDSVVLTAFGLQRDLQHAFDACNQGAPPSRETIEATLNEARGSKVYMKEIELAETLLASSTQLEHRAREALCNGLAVATEESYKLAMEMENELKKFPIQASLRRSLRQRCEVITLCSKARMLLSKASKNSTDMVQQELFELKQQCASRLESATGIDNEMLRAGLRDISPIGWIVEARSILEKGGLASRVFQLLTEATSPDNSSVISSEEFQRLQSLVERVGMQDTACRDLLERYRVLVSQLDKAVQQVAPKHSRKSLQNTQQRQLLSEPAELGPLFQELKQQMQTLHKWLQLFKQQRQLYQRLDVRDERISEELSRVETEADSLTLHMQYGVLIYHALASKHPANTSSPPVVKMSALLELVKRPFVLVSIPKSMTADLLTSFVLEVVEKCNRWIERVKIVLPSQQTSARSRPRKRSAAGTSGPSIADVRSLLCEPLCGAVSMPGYEELSKLNDTFNTWRGQLKELLLRHSSSNHNFGLDLGSGLDGIDPWQMCVQADNLETIGISIPVTAPEKRALQWAKNVFVWVSETPEFVLVPDGARVRTSDPSGSGPELMTVSLKTTVGYIQKGEMILRALDSELQAVLHDLGVMNILDPGSGDVSLIPGGVLREEANGVLQFFGRGLGVLRHKVAQSEDWGKSARLILNASMSEQDKRVLLQPMIGKLSVMSVRIATDVAKDVYACLGMKLPDQYVESTSTADESSLGRSLVVDDDSSWAENFDDTDDRGLHTKRLKKLPPLQEQSRPSQGPSPKNGTDKKRKPLANRPVLARMLSAESSISLASDGLPEDASKQRRIQSKAGQGRPCLNIECPWDATEDSWYCSDTCAVSNSEATLKHLVDFKSSLCSAWASMPYNLAPKTETQSLLLESLGVSAPDLRAFGPSPISAGSLDIMVRIAKAIGIDVDAAEEGDEIRGFMKKWPAGDVPSKFGAEADETKDSWSAADLAAFLPRCSREVFASLIGPDKRMKYSLCNPPGPSELVSVVCAPNSPGAHTRDKTYGPRLTVRRQFELVFLDIVKDILTANPNKQGTMSAAPTAVVFAQELESALHDQYPFLNELGSAATQLKKDYRTRFLSLKGNLPRNMQLAEAIINGDRTCKEICAMSVHELAAPDVQSRRAKLAAEFKRDAITDRSLVEEMDAMRRNTELGVRGGAIGLTALPAIITQAQENDIESNVALPSQSPSGSSTFPTSVPAFVPKPSPTSSIAAAKKRSAPVTSTRELLLLQSKKAKTHEKPQSSRSDPRDQGAFANQDEEYDASSAAASGSVTKPGTGTGGAKVKGCTRLLNSSGTHEFRFIHPQYPPFTGTAVTMDRRMQGVVPADITVNGRLAPEACQNYVNQVITRGTRFVVPLCITINDPFSSDNGYQSFINLCQQNKRVGVCDLDITKKENKLLYVIPHHMKHLFKILMNAFPEETDPSLMYGVLLTKEMGPSGMVDA